MTRPFSSSVVRVRPVLAGPVLCVSALRGVSLLCVVLGWGGVFRGVNYFCMTGFLRCRRCRAKERATHTHAIYMSPGPIYPDLYASSYTRLLTLEICLCLCLTGVLPWPNYGPHRLGRSVYGPYLRFIVVVSPRRYEPLRASCCGGEGDGRCLVGGKLIILR